MPFTGCTSNLKFHAQEAQDDTDCTGEKDVQAGGERIADIGKVEYTGCKEGKIIRDNSVSTILGQVFVFLLGFSVICSVAFLAIKGFSGLGVAPVVGGFAPIVIAACYCCYLWIKRLVKKDV